LEEEFATEVREKGNMFLIKNEIWALFNRKYDSFKGRQPLVHR
jgi:hypothetical protein